MIKEKEIQRRLKQTRASGWQDMSSDAGSRKKKAHTVSCAEAYWAVVNGVVKSSELALAKCERC